MPFTRSDSSKNTVIGAYDFFWLFIWNVNKKLYECEKCSNRKAQFLTQNLSCFPEFLFFSIVTQLFLQLENKRMIATKMRVYSV